MKRLITPALAVLFIIGAAHAETRSHRGFDSVSATDQIRVELTAGGAYEVEVTGRDADRVETVVDDDTLKIRMRNRPWFRSQRLDAAVRVSMPEIESVAAARGVELRASNVNADSFEIAASMGAEVEISGRCRSLDASASMGAVIRADALQCETADVSASMGGTARVYASESYDGSASMGGTINISGDGASRGHATAMGGTINN